MGANDQEADGAASKKDFLAKYVIVRKETKETKYWLSFIADAELLGRKFVDPNINECEEIQKIVSKIIENTKR